MKQITVITKYTLILKKKVKQITVITRYTLILKMMKIFQVVNVWTGRKTIYHASIYFQSYTPIMDGNGLIYQRATEESPYLTIDREVIFKQVSDTKNENDDHTPNTLNLDEQELKGNNFAEEKRSIDIKDIPKPTFPKRTSVTRCCDLLAKIKSLVHECTKSTALEKLEKVKSQVSP